MNSSDASGRNGRYRCQACGAVLFRSEARFDGQTGYPTFRRPASRESVRAVERASHGVERTQVCCAACGAHLGHVFSRQKQGQPVRRYCIARDVLTFDPNAAAG